MSGSNNATLTQCPHCDTVFQVSDEQLHVAQGRVRCGRCQGVFDALAHLYEQTGENDVAIPREPHASAQTWESDEPDDTPYIIASRDDDSWAPIRSETADDADVAAENVDVAQDAVEVALTVGTNAVETIASESVETAVEAVPEINLAETLPRIDIVDVLRDQLGEQAPPLPAASRSLAWSLLAMLLMLTLAGQYLFFTRADLARYEPLRPWLQRTCTYLGCELPLRHAPGQIELLSRDVISHPRIRDALLINATFVNRASYAQVYPVLQISLSNESGTVVAMRRFQPEEYLAQGAHIAAGMVPGAPVRVVMEVVEPKHDATSFQFEFL
jgi:predicted Zn finger-like uncharacterized protein